MGANLCTPSKCSEPETPSVLTLSESVVNRLETGNLGAPPITCSLKDTSDDEYYIKLRCLEEQHDREFGLSLNTLEQMATQFEGINKKKDPPCHAALEAVSRCYKNHEGCEMECWQEVEIFERCIAKKREDILLRIAMKEETERKRQELSKLIKEESNY